MITHMLYYSLRNILTNRLFTRSNRIAQPVAADSFYSCQVGGTLSISLISVKLALSNEEDSKK